MVSLPWPNGEKKLPVVLSTKEAASLLSRIDNLKHRCILWIIYSGGLRISEAVHLRLKDIDFDRMQLHIRKGKKDSYTVLSRKTGILLQQYLAENKPTDWLFQGQKGGIYSVQKYSDDFYESNAKFWNK